MLLLMRVENTNYRHHCHLLNKYKELRVTVNLFSLSFTVTHRHRLTALFTRCSLHNVAPLRRVEPARGQESHLTSTANPCTSVCPQARMLSAFTGVRPSVVRGFAVEACNAL